jgi:membrane protease YdiL (CAAX protease family)
VEVAAPQVRAGVAPGVAAVAGAALIVAAEVVLAVVGVTAGVVCLAVVVFLLLNAEALQPRAALPALMALVPMLAIMGSAIPTRDVPQMYWYAMAGGPVLVTVWAVGRVTPVSWSSLAIRGVDLRAQLPIALAGVPLSVAAYAILRPAPLVPHLASFRFLLAAVILLVCVAFAEELVFRCVLQQAAEAALGGTRGRILVSLLFAAAYIGCLSASYVVFIGIVGLRFSAVVAQTRSLWGVVAAHAFLDIGLLLVWPLVWPS